LTHCVGYEAGLEKLASTASSVQGMQKELEDLKPNLIKAQEDTDRLVLRIEKDSAEAEETRKIVAREEAQVNQAAMASKKIRDECER